MSPQQINLSMNALLKCINSTEMPMAGSAGPIKLSIEQKYHILLGGVQALEAATRTVNTGVGAQSR